MMQYILLLFRMLLKKDSEHAEMATRNVTGNIRFSLSNLFPTTKFKKFEELLIYRLVWAK